MPQVAERLSKILHFRRKRKSKKKLDPNDPENSWDWEPSPPKADRSRFLSIEKLFDEDRASSPLEPVPVPIEAPPSGPSRLLSLPPEIRQQIWELLFTAPSSLSLSLQTRAAADESILNYLLLSKLVYRECWHLFYALNTLVLSSPFKLSEFLSSLHPLRRNEIRRLHVQGFGFHYTGYINAPKAFSLLLLCPRLQSFTLDLTSQYSWDVLEVPPGEDHEREWQIAQRALDILKQLRGLREGSIRGVRPSKWSQRMVHDAKRIGEMEECELERIVAIRKWWLRPQIGDEASRLARMRVERALVGASKGKGKQRQGKSEAPGGAVEESGDLSEVEELRCSEAGQLYRRFVALDDYSPSDAEFYDAREEQPRRLPVTGVRTGERGGRRRGGEEVLGEEADAPAGDADTSDVSELDQTEAGLDVDWRPPTHGERAHHLSPDMPKAPKKRTVLDHGTISRMTKHEKKLYEVFADLPDVS